MHAGSASRKGTKARKFELGGDPIVDSTYYVSGSMYMYMQVRHMRSGYLGLSPLGMCDYKWVVIYGGGGAKLKDLARSSSEGRGEGEVRLGMTWWSMGCWQGLELLMLCYCWVI